MIEFDLGLLADHAQVDAGGKLYVMGEFRYIFAQTVPCTHPHMSVVGRWRADVTPGVELTASLQVEVVDSDGKPIVPRSPSMPVTFSSVGPADRGKGQCMLILNLTMLHLPKYGDYSISFLVDGGFLGRVPFTVSPPPPRLPA